MSVNQILGHLYPGDIALHTNLSYPVPPGRSYNMDADAGIPLSSLPYGGDFKWQEYEAQQEDDFVISPSIPKSVQEVQDPYVDAEEHRLKGMREAYEKQQDNLLKEENKEQVDAAEEAVLKHKDAIGRSAVDMAVEHMNNQGDEDSNDLMAIENFEGIFDKPKHAADELSVLRKGAEDRGLSVFESAIEKGVRNAKNLVEAMNGERLAMEDVKDARRIVEQDLAKLSLRHLARTKIEKALEEDDQKERDDLTKDAVETLNRSFKPLDLEALKEERNLGRLLSVLEYSRA